MNIGSDVVYRGEFGTIIGDGDDGRASWWIVETVDGKRHSPSPDSPYLAPLNRQTFVRAVLNSVAARHLPVDRAAELIDLVTR